MREGLDRNSKRKNHAKPDRIIEKRPKWQDYLDPEEDPGLLDDAESPDSDEEDIAEEESDAGAGPSGKEEEDS